MFRYTTCPEFSTKMMDERKWHIETRNAMQQRSARTINATAVVARRMSVVDTCRNATYLFCNNNQLNNENVETTRETRAVDEKLWFLVRSRYTTAPRL